mmetsp:Transcript_13907/g.35508  ORF Transcript_13907/g.35508 Transcript_13907/m.35508 type:complete len:205 (+) Transcript_13907:674-1288(+)
MVGHVDALEEGKKRAGVPGSTVGQPAVVGVVQEIVEHHRIRHVPPVEGSRRLTKDSVRNLQQDHDYCASQEHARKEHEHDPNPYVFERGAGQVGCGVHPLVPQNGGQVNEHGAQATHEHVRHGNPDIQKGCHKHGDWPKVHANAYHQAVLLLCWHICAVRCALHQLQLSVQHTTGQKGRGKVGRAGVIQRGRHGERPLCVPAGR